MILPIDIQIYYFISTIIAGVVVGVLFDIYRVVLFYNNPSRVLLAITDLLYWILCAMIIFLLFLYTNNGNIRYYTVIGSIFGLFLYFKLASKKFIIVLRNAVLIIMRVIRIVYMGVVYPMRYIVYFLKYAFMKIKGLLSRKSNKEI